jgi:hypothetical protein
MQPYIEWILLCAVLTVVVYMLRYLILDWLNYIIPRRIILKIILQLRTTTMDNIPEVINQLAINNSNIKGIMCNEGYYNCYAFVALQYGWISQLEWIPVNAMFKWIQERTVETDIPEIGDILIITPKGELKVYDDLLHTALVINPKTMNIIHKPGQRILCINTLEEAVNTYKTAYNEVEISYRKVING